MELKTHRNVAVMDLDGVFVQNPVESLGKNTITDNNYWARHWNKPDEATLNVEMCELAQSLVATDWQLIILTARPEQYRKQTERLLLRAGVAVLPRKYPDVGGDWVTTNAPILVMLDQHDVPAGSAGWKQEMLKKWVDAGNRIRLFVEDYRPNAEAARCVVPVLLYERKKISQHLAGCPYCGGLATCWCTVIKP